MLKNTLQSYGSVTKILHWTIALLIISLLGVGLYMTDMPDGDQKWYIYDVHKEIGMLVLTLVLIRVLWRLTNKNPELSVRLPHWQRTTANWTHYALYGFMIVMPLSGYLSSVFGNHPIDMFGFFTIPALAEGPNAVGGFTHFLHEQIPFILIAVITIHIFAALYHHFVLKRMLP
jgi:cytochrome b561